MRHGPHLILISSLYHLLYLSFYLYVLCSNYYCIIQDGKNFVTGKFNENAENLLKSQVNVKPATPLTITQNGILATSSSNIPVLLNTKDLSQIKN